MIERNNYIEDQLRLAWESIGLFQQDIAHYRNEIQIAKQKIWLKMVSVNALTARQKEKEIVWANLGADMEDHNDE